MSRSPDGTLFVVDREAGVVRRFAANGRPLDPLGGPGGNSGAFFQPADVDATSGLFVVVADAGNGRVQRFSARDALVEVLPIPATHVDQGRTPQPVFRAGDPGKGEAGGRPVAVALSDNDDLYVLEAGSGQVLMTDRQRTEWRVIGGQNAGPGRVVRPVDLSFYDGRLYVADAGSATVKVFDAFGSHVRDLSPGLLRGVRAVQAGPSGVTVVLPLAIHVYETRGFLQERVALVLAVPGGRASAEDAPEQTAGDGPNGEPVTALDAFATRDRRYVLSKTYVMAEVTNR